MNRYHLLLFSALLLLLAACGQDAQPSVNAPSFSFAVDPATGSVELETSSLSGLDVPSCESGTRTLTPGNELKLADYDFVFLPGNLLRITAAFTNTTFNTYEQPFSFLGTSENVISTTEPEVSDADLGDDGKLSPYETTTVLTFEVEHKGQAFTYGVSAEAEVVCGERPEGADLVVSQTDEQDPVVFDPTYGPEGLSFTYTVTVQNIGKAAADEVELFDTFSEGGPFFLSSVLPPGCDYALEITQPGPNPSSSVVCNLGTLDTNDIREYTFTFSFGFFPCASVSTACAQTGGSAQATSALSFAPQQEDGPTVANYAEVTTTSPEANTENNTSVEETTVILSEPPAVITLYADCDFQGASFGLDVGDYTTNDLVALGISDNDISSIRVEPGFQIEIFDDDNFGGQSLTFTSDDGCLVDDNFNDRLSSVRITAVDNSTPTGPPACTDPVSIPDGNLEAKVRAQLGKPSGDITCADMESLTSLNAYGASVSSLEGLQYAVNLTVLELPFNPISDLSPLAELTSLQKLDIGFISSSNFSTLAGLTDLKELLIGGNSINDLSFVENLTNITYLYLNDNQISNITPLSSLTNLQTLYLANNQISDIGALVTNPGIGDELDQIFLSNNCLDLSLGAQAQMDIDDIEARSPGQQVFTDPQNGFQCPV